MAIDVRTPDALALKTRTASAATLASATASAEMAGSYLNLRGGSAGWPQHLTSPAPPALLAAAPS